MDPNLSGLSGSGLLTAVLVINISQTFLQVFQLSLNSRTKNKDDELNFLREEVKNLRQKVSELETRTFELEKENATLTGLLLSSAEDRDAAIRQVVSKRLATKSSSSEKVGN
jgi:hypothetical protein